MKAIKYLFERRGTTIFIEDYPEYLDKVKSVLPENVYKFASYDEHYDFYSKYCTHDLTFEKFYFNNLENGVNIIIILKGSPFKHTSDLEIEYFNVSNLFVSKEKDEQNEPFSDLIIDEISIDEVTQLCVHELAFYGGNIKIYFQDLKFKWD
jgi:hypothetical protein